jgi:predicted N-acetyltransferase YhbS
MEVVIEQMDDYDIQTVAQLRVATFFEGADRTLDEDMTGLRKLLTTSDGFEVSLVARVHGELAGTVLLVRNEIEASHKLTPWLAGLVVKQDFRLLGVGTMLVKAVEAHGATMGVKTLHLYTWDAQDFYASLGWQVVERFRQDGEPMVLMSRDLQL